MKTKASMPRILVIDDEVPMCMGIKNLLSIDGYTVEYTTTAEEGIHYLESHPETDVVLLDINLGSGLSGTKALPIIKEKCKYTQVVMFTSMSDLETGLACMKKGALDYITKPFDDENLLRVLTLAVETKKIEQLNDIYLNVIVHDLKNPLQQIIGTLEFFRISLKEELTKQHTKLLDAADHATSQITTMINNILSISKFEKGTLRMRSEPFLLKDQLTAALEQCKNEVGNLQKTITTDFNSLDDSHTINTDKEFFSRVVCNIVSNAFRFTPPGGQIHIGTKKLDNQTIQISVTNSGSYIEEENKESIFNKFSCIQKETHYSSGQNFGLGLTYCRMAVEAMDGRIWVESCKEVPQTTFHFTVKNQKDVKNES